MGKAWSLRYEHFAVLHAYYEVAYGLTARHEVWRVAGKQLSSTSALPFSQFRALATHGALSVAAGGTKRSDFNAMHMQCPMFTVRSFLERLGSRPQVSRTWGGSQPPSLRLHQAQCGRSSNDLALGVRCHALAVAPSLSVFACASAVRSFLQRLQTPCKKVVETGNKIF